MYILTPSGKARIDQGGNEPFSAAWMVTFAAYMHARPCHLGDFTTHALLTIRAPDQPKEVIHEAVKLLFRPSEHVKKAIELGWVALK